MHQVQLLGINLSDGGKIFIYEIEISIYILICAL